MNANELIDKIKNGDEKVRADAWQAAGPIGASAVKPLVGLMTDADIETTRAAKRACWLIVRHAGRPGAGQEVAAVVGALVGLLTDDQPSAVRREVLWMLSEIAGDEAIDPVAGLLKHPELREDARMALQRIPGSKSLSALKRGFEAAPEDFRPNLAQSLRARGEQVNGYPSQKLVPTRKTTIRPQSGS